MTIDNHINNISNLISSIIEENKKLDRKHNVDCNLDPNPFDTKDIHRVYDENSHESKLEKYLLSMNEEDLKRIHAMLYSGRDSVSAISRKESFKGEPLESIIDTILDKYPYFEDYIEKCYKFSENKNIDFNNF